MYRFDAVRSYNNAELYVVKINGRVTICFISHSTSKNSLEEKKTATKTQEKGEMAVVALPWISSRGLRL